MTDSSNDAVESTPQLWAGRGSGRLCDYCRRAITADDVEYEFKPADVPARFFHMSCFDEWKTANGVKIP
jgi:hypothetical protein